MRIFALLLPRPYHEDMSNSVLIGIDIGGTKIRVASALQPQKLEASADIPTPHQFAVAQQLILEQITALASGRPVSSIGIASPAPVNMPAGTIGHPSHLSWKKAPMKSWLNQYFDCPVTLIHDAQAGGVCESRYGSGKDYRYVLYVSLSTGIGSALILDKVPLPGPHNPEGGRMILEAHTSHPELASFENRASGTAIVKKYGVRAAEITSRAKWDAIAYEIALGLNNLILATDPEIVVLGGGVSVHFKKFIRPLRAHLKRFSHLYPLPPIKAADYIEHAPLIGSLSMANDALETS